MFFISVGGENWELINLLRTKDSIFCSWTEIATLFNALLTTLNGRWAEDDSLQTWHILHLYCHLIQQFRVQ
jgi:hypothetical protein